MIDDAYIESLRIRLPEIEAKLSDPATAADQKQFRELVKQHAALKKIETLASRYLQLQSDLAEHREILADPEADPELRELAEGEIEELEACLPEQKRALMVSLLPADPAEERSAIVEIRAGTGGDEAALFAGDLFRMYSRYAEHEGWRIGMIDASPSEVGGYKEVVFSVEGTGVYGRLRYEGGGHRVQRVPVTESQGRIHTSAEPEDEIEIPHEDVRVDIFRSSGPGGQSVNTTDSAVRLTHLPTGIVVQCQDEKSQHRNKEKAMNVLKARILDMKQQEEAAKMGQTRRSMIGSGDRSERVRTYNFPQNRLTDHRINLTLYSLDRIMDGELAEVLNSLREHDVELRLQAEMKGVNGRK
jgi:peptide chain release factor 1